MTTHEIEFQQSHPIEIEGQNGLKLRQSFVEDAAAYFALIDSNRAHFGQEHLGGTDETAEKYPDLQSVINSITHPKNEDKLRFGIWDGENLVGTINLTPQEDRTAEIGYAIGEQFARRGYATEALGSLKDYAFDQGYKMLFAKVFTGNNASKNLLLKNGFDFKGLVKETDEDGTVKWLLRFEMESPTASR